MKERQLQTPRSWREADTAPDGQAVGAAEALLPWNDSKPSVAMAHSQDHDLDQHCHSLDPASLHTGGRGLCAKRQNVSSMSLSIFQAFSDCSNRQASLYKGDPAKATKRLQCPFCLLSLIYSPSKSSGTENCGAPGTPFISIVSGTLVSQLRAQ